ncbi:hypothetical protein [Polynucleobacter necessarius]|uniref:hypothetical protein n=1 Tax=Polynucleobacter necessarius TaxID=576610 RepID=UPI0018D4E43F|nr:hypothetical protein [Polynucleobacter necessarius]
MLFAEVQVEGDLDDASSQGFRLIQISEKIAMTAPVIVVDQSLKSSKIAMTVPGGIEPNAGK